MASVTFPTEYGGDGKTYTDDADPTTGLDGTGYITRFVPTLAGSVAMAAHATQKADEADQSAQSASASAQQANEDRDSINLDLQTLNGLVADAQGSADAAASSATTASNLADAVAEATATYTSVSAGLAATVDTNYFRVIEAPEAERVSVYRNDSGSATRITTYYTKTGVDAKQAAAVRLNRSLQRLGDNGQTLHSDFNLDAYGLGSQLVGGVQDAMEAEELWQVQRLSGTYALQHVDDGSLKYVEVPPNVLAREYNPETGQYQAQFSGAVTNELLKSCAFNGSPWVSTRIVSEISSEPSVIDNYPVFKLRETATLGTHYLAQNLSLDGAVIRSMSFILKASNRNLVRLRLTGGLFSDNVSVVFNLSSGSVVDSSSGGVGSNLDVSFEEIPGGWFRVNLSGSLAGETVLRAIIEIADETGAYSYQGDGTSGIYIAHAQLVEDTTPGPVIVTEDAPVTRAEDNVSRELGAEFNASGFTLLLNVQNMQTIHTFYVPIEISTGPSNRIRIAGNYPVNTIRIESTVDGSSSISANIITTIPEIKKIGLSYDGDTLHLVVDGGAPVSLGFSPEMVNPTLTMFIQTTCGAELLELSPRFSSVAQLQELTTL